MTLLFPVLCLAVPPNDSGYVGVFIEYQDPFGYGSIQGWPHWIHIRLDSSDIPLESMDLTIGFDSSHFDLVAVQFANAYSQPVFESSSYTLYEGPGGTLPNQLIRFRGTFAQEYRDSALGELGLARLLVVTSDRPGLACDTLPLQFAWIDCKDNVLTASSGQKLIVANVQGPTGNPVASSDSLPCTYPSQLTCPGTSERRRIVRYSNGGVHIVCPTAIDDRRGDMNHNDIPCEVADLLMLADYMVMGDEALRSLPDSLWYWAKLRTDMNLDYVFGTIEDYQALHNCVVSGISPPPGPPTTNGEITVLQYTDLSDILVFTQGSAEIGSLYLRYDGVMELDEAPPRMSLLSYFDGRYTHVLISGSVVHDPGTIHDFWATGYVGGGRLDSAAAADPNAYSLVCRLDVTTVADEPDNAPSIPTRYSLDQNYPNPFNPSTTIDFTIPVAAPVELTITNTAGRRVRTLVSTYLPAGTHYAQWDGRNDHGDEVATGVYFYRLVAGEFMQTRKMLLVR